MGKSLQYWKEKLSKEAYARLEQSYKAAVSDKVAGASAIRKPDASLAEIMPVEVFGGPTFNTPVRVHFHSVRKCLADMDNLSGKAALDGIVKMHVLQDDRPQFIPERPTHTQVKGEPEETIITIEEI